MAINVKDNGGGDFEICPVGTRQGIVSNVYDLGYQKSNSPTGGVVHEVALLFELNTTMTKGTYAGFRFTLVKRYTASLNEKANLRKDAEALLGRALTEKEVKEDGFDIEQLRGLNCYISVFHKPGKDGKTYANIKTIMQLPDGVSLIEPELESGYCPEWIDKLIKNQLQKPKDVSPDVPTPVPAASKPNANQQQQKQSLDSKVIANNYELIERFLVVDPEMGETWINDKYAEKYPTEGLSRLIVARTSKVLWDEYNAGLLPELLIKAKEIAPNARTFDKMTADQIMKVYNECHGLPSGDDLFAFNPTPINPGV